MSAAAAAYWPALACLATSAIFAVTVVHLRIFPLATPFRYAVANSLVLVGIFAAGVTDAHTVLLVPAIYLATLAVRTRPVPLGIDLSGWRITLALVGCAGAFALALDIAAGLVVIGHEDQLYIARLAATNLQYGVENVGLFHNLAFADYPRVEFYHHFDSWIIGLGTRLNGQTSIYNYFFFALPVAAVLVGWGLKGLLDAADPESRPRRATLLVLTLGLGFFAHPWDVFAVWPSWDWQSPVTGVGGWIGDGKRAFSMVLGIGIADFIVRRDREAGIGMLLSCFMMLTAMPIVAVWYAGLILWQGGQAGLAGARRKFGWALALPVGVAAFYALAETSSAGNAHVGGLALERWLEFPGNWRFVPAIVAKCFLIPLAGIAPVVVARRRSLQRVGLSTWFCVVTLWSTCVGVWLAFVLNLNANQAFTVLFGALLPIFVIWQIFLTGQERPRTAVALMCLYALPGVWASVRREPLVQPVSTATIEFLESLDDSRLLYLPRSEEEPSPYRRFETIYSGVNEFVLYNENLALYSVSGAAPWDRASANDVVNASNAKQQTRSAYYRACGEWTVGDPCLLRFLRRNRIEYLCSRDPDLRVPGYAVVYQGDGYRFLKAAAGPGD